MRQVKLDWVPFELALENVVGEVGQDFGARIKQSDEQIVLLLKDTVDDGIRNGVNRPDSLLLDAEQLRDVNVLQHLAVIEQHHVEALLGEVRQAKHNWRLAVAA